MQSIFQDECLIKLNDVGSIINFIEDRYEELKDLSNFIYRFTPGGILNEMLQNDLNSADLGVSLRKETFGEGEVGDDIYVVVGGMGEGGVVFSRDLRVL